MGLLFPALYVSTSGPPPHGTLWADFLPQFSIFVLPVVAALVVLALERNKPLPVASGVIWAALAAYFGLLFAPYIAEVNPGDVAPRKVVAMLCAGALGIGATALQVRIAHLRQMLAERDRRAAFNEMRVASAVDRNRLVAEVVTRVSRPWWRRR
ncbi:hypothetical protein E3T28_13020 [Cryobacterium sinapicolor]|uniref:MASE1 domain-containing protein n=1 Tax=Cryobacterium sinapicolor TaxID=1259236 RepID=A0ABY2IW33_9MICO|nr:hypothetical protein [Cryobacterium sinapicolor]TFC95888.1 hypothetical protein E3T28_13020 [Cryobacterium sinapicolor]